MAKYTFYGGAGEIGGNKILLEDRDVRAYLDFGQSFNFGSGYFYDYLQPRSVNGLEILFEFGLIPRIPRLYARDALRFTDLPYGRPDIDAVFISHHHGDHTGHLSCIDESIPVYMGHGTRKIIEIYNSLYRGVCDIGDHESIRTFRSGDCIELKHMTFQPIHVEHSTPGAYGYVIDSPDSSIVYTGDFRRHGPKAEYTEEFISRAAKAGPEVMLCEGTRMTSDMEKQFSEEQVYEKIREVIEGSQGIVFGDFAMINVDRFMSFYRACVEDGRILVVDTKMAYLLDNLREKIPAIPDPCCDGNMRVYFRLAKSCTFSEKDYLPYERRYYPRRITYREITGDQRRYVMLINFNKMIELVYLKPRHADYIYSSSEHFLEGEENREMRTVMENWLSHFGIALHKAHCSGHAGRGDIEYAVKKIKPDILIPVHTDNPEGFEDIHSDVRIPEKGGTLEI